MAGQFPFASYFNEIRTLADLQFTRGEEPYLDRPPKLDRPQADVKPPEFVLYLGCNVLRTAHLAKAAIDVLKAMGFDFQAVGGPSYCCGIVHFLNGEPAAAHKYAGNTLRSLAQLGAAKVVMWCPSCNEHFDEVVTKHHRVDFPYEHVTAFIARHLDRIRFVRRIEKKVALHYHTGHPQQDLDWASTRTILRAIPGLEYLEVPNSPELGRHCSPNYVGKLGPAVWRDRIAAIMRSAAAVQVDILATIYHSCHREICDQEARYPFEIVNYISLLAEAMGIEHPDVYKRYKLMGDPDAVFEAVREHVQANRLDPARVREVLARAFAPSCEGHWPNPS